MSLNSHVRLLPSTSGGQCLRHDAVLCRVTRVALSRVRPIPTAGSALHPTAEPRCPVGTLGLAGGNRPLTHIRRRAGAEPPDRQ